MRTSRLERAGALFCASSRIGLVSGTVHVTVTSSATVTADASVSATALPLRETPETLRAAPSTVTAKAPSAGVAVSSSASP